MNNLEEGQVLKWMGYLMFGCFCWITCFYFQGALMKIIDMFALLPLWWFLIVLPLFAIAVVLSISLGEQEIEAIEEETKQNQRKMSRRSRCFQLLSLDMTQLSQAEFCYYCADLLCLLNFNEVQVVCSTQMQMKNEQGNPVYAECYLKPNEVVDKQRIELFYQEMKAHEAEEGILISMTSFTEEAKELANSYGIKWSDEKFLKELVVLGVIDGDNPVSHFTKRQSSMKGFYTDSDKPLVSHEQAF